MQFRRETQGREGLSWNTRTQNLVERQAQELTRGAKRWEHALHAQVVANGSRAQTAFPLCRISFHSNSQAGIEPGLGASAKRLADTPEMDIDYLKGKLRPPSQTSREHTVYDNYLERWLLPAPSTLNTSTTHTELNGIRTLGSAVVSSRPKCPARTVVLANHVGRVPR